MGTGVSPISSDSRAPWIRRESMSRPNSSAPSGNLGVPMGFNRLSMEPLVGSAGAR